MVRQPRLHNIAFFVLSCLVLTTSHARHVQANDKSCLAEFLRITLKNLDHNRGQPFVLYADGTRVALSKACEKEGLWYSDIAHWFDHIDRNKFETKLIARLQAEKEGKQPRTLTRWLENWESHSRAREISKKELPWYQRKKANQRQPTAEEVLNYLLSYDQPFDGISIQGRESLFYDGILSFDDLRASSHTPDFMAVSQDVRGSYEVKSAKGESDINLYRDRRAVIEDHLDSKIGHQHLVHAWPENAERRAQMAPHYIELLDSTNWLLFWRQMKRDPDEVDSILFHKYLGVYPRSNLERLHEAVVEGNAKKFKDKYKMMGARAMNGDPLIPGQEGKVLPDWEQRSGNKNFEVRAYVEDLVSARISSGDYSGLRDFRSYQFDPSSPLTELLPKTITPEEIALIKEFEESFAYLKHSTHKRSNNHFRNRLISPLLPWQNRLPLSPGQIGNLSDAQEKYAKELVALARKYRKWHPTLLEKNDRAALLDLREKTMSEFESLLSDFAEDVRLDLAFKRYIFPKTKQAPNILVQSTGPLDVNQVNLGIEFSYRFHKTPHSIDEAIQQIREAAESLRTSLGGGKIEEMSTAGHGHNIGYKLKITDPKGRAWRVEWDGIRRSYRNGEPYWLRGGHIEAPTPKIIPESTEEIDLLYSAMQKAGFYPKRSAGGAHLNVDLAPLYALPPKEGASKARNLITYFESNREMIGFLWQHPYRVRSGLPVEVSSDTAYRLTHFNGDWNDLSELLYHTQYFNTHVGRKPGYTQLNALALMHDSVPAAYKNTIDIKKPNKRWFPAFGGKGKDRLEFRLFDAPEDETMAALQIKYIRAILDRAFNSKSPIPLKSPYTAQSREIWRTRPDIFLKDASDHFKSLGLDPNEYILAMRQAFEIQQYDSKYLQKKVKRNPYYLKKISREK